MNKILIKINLYKIKIVWTQVKGLHTENLLLPF